MKQLVKFKLAGWLAVGVLLAPAALAQRQLEKLGRGVIAMRTDTNSVYVGWRLLGTDPADTKFNLYRVTGGVTNLLGAGLTNSCNFVDTTATQALAHAWFVQPVLDGVTQAVSTAFSMASNAPIRQYLDLPLNPPAGGTAYDGVAYTYNANDASVGDVDGDGEYEIILKWDPSNSKDNSLSGFTGDTFLDCYKLDGTRLWRIDLGPNIRSGAHYLPFMVYDFDGDGKAEVMCRTAPGALDGLGHYVGGTNKWQNVNGAHPAFNDTNDYRFSNPNNTTNGYVLAGPEFITVFNGQTGAELASATYFPQRDPDNHNDNPTAARINSVWGDSYGNRLDRFLAGVAFLDGTRPSAVFCRGYYTRAYLAAWDWRHGALALRWTFAATPGTNTAYEGQGAHSLTIGDVDADGRDEIIYGAAAIDDNGQGLYSTGLGHGDALHLSDMDPSRNGLEVWMVHEEPDNYGAAGEEFRDAKTGALIFGVAGGGDDIGRGVAYDIDPRYPGCEMWGTVGGLMSASGTQISSSKPGAKNFCVWWDADWLRESLDDTTIYKWDWTNHANNAILSPGGIDSNNGTKATPCLSADIFGDWREEVIWRTTNNSDLCIYTTTLVATNRFYTLMHDAQYRCAIAWQNTGYNQPPHPGFFLGSGMFPPPVPLISSADLVWRGSAANIWDAGTTANWLTNGVWSGNDAAVVFSAGQSVLFSLSGSNAAAVSLGGTLQPGDVMVNAAQDYTFAGSGALTGTMKLTKAGPGRLTLANTNAYTGATRVSGGSLFVNGVLPASAVTVERRGTPEGPSQFGGGGRLGGGLTVQTGCILTVGPDTNAPGTLTVTNTLTELGGVVNQFDLSDDPTGLVKTNDLLKVAGNVAVSGTNYFDLTLLNGTLSNGVYTLLQYCGTLTGGLTNFSVRGTGGKMAVLTNLTGAIALRVIFDRPPTNVLWTGGLATNTWNQSGVSNWLNGSARDLFTYNDLVTFNDTGTTNTTVNLSGDLYPGSVTVNSSLNYTFSGSGGITGPTALAQLGAGMLTVLTTNAYTGPTLLGNGVLAVSTVTSGGIVGPLGAAASDSSNLVFTGGATLRYLGTSAGTDRGATLNAGGGTVEITNSAATLTLSGPLTGAGSLKKMGPGVLALTGANDFSGGTLISTGAVQVGSGAASGTLGAGGVTNNGLLIFNRSDAVAFDQIIAGTGSVVKNGSGSVTLTQSNLYSGTTTNLTGTLILSNNAALGTGPLVFVAGSVQLADGVVVTNAWNLPGATVDLMLDCPAGTGVWAGPVSVSSGGSFRPGTSSGSGTVVYTGKAGMGSANFIVPRGNFTVASNSIISASGSMCALGRSTSGSGTAVIARDNAALTFGSGLQFGGAMASPGPLSLTMQDNATVSTGATNFDLHNSTSSSAVTVVNLNGGTLAVGGFTKTRTGSGQTATLNFNGGKLKANTNNAAFVPALAGLTANVLAGGAVLDDSGFALTTTVPLVHPAALGATLDGGLTKLGAGTLTLNATETYTGPTTVNAGTLALAAAASVTNSSSLNLVAGVLDVSAVTGFTLAGGQKITGTGAVNGNMTIGSGAMLAPGTDIGTLTFSNALTLAAGSTNLFALSKSPLTNDVARVLGTLTNGGTLIVTNLSAAALAAGDRFRLFAAASYAGSFARVQLPPPGYGLAWNTNALNTSGTITVVTVPVNPPVFTAMTPAGDHFFFTTTGGVSGSLAYLLWGTNLTVPASNWLWLQTNYFDRQGVVNFTSPVVPGAPQGFYRLLTP
jgi:rhamnogalacturonan endolyase